MYGRPFQAMIGVGGMYVNQERKVKNCVQHLSQTLAMINDLACIRDLCTTSPLQPFEPTGKVLLKTWKTGSPESQLEEKWTGTYVKQTFMFCRHLYYPGKIIGDLW